ncbi:LamG-like jellyroll fold domain-containing protein [Anaerobaca lacustris]|uniref:Discoidin domain-containing protein n=1 Tax=Anaerobaca lacustris TaxID=3044600 RepID=A0AAW6U2P0_9BACT|nr:discoidin domain-containing protein [Sedimentisphaerales bacterium M17dextr]
MLKRPIPRTLNVCLLFLGCLSTAMPTAYGDSGYALEVSGATVTIEDPQDVLRLSSYTYEFWLKDLQGPTGSWRNMFCKGSGDVSAGRGPLLAMRPDEQGLHYDHSTGSGQSTLDIMEGIRPNEWIHVSLVLTALDGEQRIYTNGVQAGTRTSAGLTNTTQEAVLQMGMGANVVLDDFRVWDHARTEAEVQEHMAQELEGDEEGLVGYWRFNEGVGTIAHDSSPSEIHGTIVNPVWRMDGAPVALAAPPAFAYGQFPAHGAVDVPVDVVLVWKPGQFAHTQDVYFGTAYNDVNDASRADLRGVLVSQGQSGTTYDPAGPLDLGRTYYWRVDTFEADGVTLHKGAVWSFTVEPVAYAIADVVATSNGISDGLSTAQRTVDGSGLNAADQHSVEAADMWLAAPNADEPLWIQFEFDRLYKLHELLVWNYNSQFEMVLGFGLKDVTIEYSADGAEWSVLADAEFAQAAARADYVANTVVDLEGIAARFVRLNVNSGWGITGQYGLSEVRFSYIPAQAREPQPIDGAANVDPDTALSWRTGREAASHEVYFGIDAAELPLVGTVAQATFAPPALDFGTTYYWRIDEAGEEVWAGELWSFSTLDFVLIDGFETYTDDIDAGEAIFDTWLDGWVNNTGSTVGYLDTPFAERSIVYSGSQSMPLQYDNTASPFYSEAERTFTSPQDWTGNGADTLRLFVAGRAPAFAEMAGGTILMNAIGNDIWDSADQFRYVYKNLSGNGSVTARVDTLDISPDIWVKAGVMIRQNAEAGAVNTFMAMTGTGGGGSTFQQRMTAGGASVSQHTYADGPFTAPYWVRVTREGSTLRGYTSPDGENWTQRGDTITLAMTDPVLIGLALTSHNVNQATSAQFSNVAFTGNVTGAWQVAEVGVAQPAGNAVAPLYVALEDATGRSAVVTHPDANIVGRSGWNEWRIPLSQFTGVNLSRVSTMMIGVGNKTNPTAGGTGVVYIDDIGFGHPAAAE